MSTEQKEEPSNFALQLAALIHTFASKAMEKEETEELLSELLDQVLHGGMALGYHPRDLIATMRERAIELAKDIRMVCVDCKGKGTVPAVLGPEGAIYECRTCKGEGSLAARVDDAQIAKQSRIAFRDIESKRAPMTNGEFGEACIGPRGDARDCPVHAKDVTSGYHPPIDTKPETLEAKATDPVAALTPDEQAFLARSRRG